MAQKSNSPDEYNGENKEPDQDSQRSAYPRQWLFKSPGGVTVSMGNEVGKEFLMVSHPSGTHWEMHQDGSMTTITNGQAQSYGKGGGSVTFDENMHATISGHVKFSAGGGAVLEVKGDMGIVCVGDLQLGVMGNMGISAKNIYMGATGKMNIESKGDMNLSTRGKQTLESKGKQNMGSDEGIEMQAPTIHQNPQGGQPGYQGPGNAPSAEGVPMS